MSSLSSFKGTLYVVSTPIGNMDDITLRAINILKQVNLIVAEDTRYTLKLLNHHHIKNRLFSCYEHNEVKRSSELADMMNEGKDIALVTNAGTPTISDPGFKVVQRSLSANINVVPVPGVSAAITALSVSGLPTDSFVFIGFLPRKTGKRHTLLESLIYEPRTLIFYESPRRLVNTLQEFLQIFGDREAVLAREMTKLHEEFIRGSISGIIDQVQSVGEIKGECTILIKGHAPDKDISPEILHEQIRQELSTFGAKDAAVAKDIAKRCGLSKKAVYDEIIKIKSTST
jgi:16S rRNA (cytidine1402-2'-O)-methyltransferase